MLDIIVFECKREYLRGIIIYKHIKTYKDESIKNLQSQKVGKRFGQGN